MLKALLKELRSWNKADPGREQSGLRAGDGEGRGASETEARGRDVSVSRPPPKASLASWNTDGRLA